MQPIQNTKPFRHFAKHLFIVGRAYSERKKARKEVDEHLQRMRNSVIRMSLSYSDIDRLKQKVDILVDRERKYAKFFKPEDKETQELKKQINELEQEVMKEREERQKLVEENNRKIAQLTDSLNNIKSKTGYLLMERAKRQQRLTALDKKIRQKVDVHRYYHS